MDILKFAKKHSSGLLCIVAAGGVIATAILTAKETPKAMKILEQKKAEKKENLTVIETVKAVAPCYVPAVVSGLMTVACIMGASVLSKKQQAAITSAYALVSSNYKRYSSKLKELYGDEAHKKILESISAEDAEKVDICSYTYFDGGSLGFGDVEEETILFYEPYSNRYFKSTLYGVLQAEYHINRNFVLGADITLNDFYSFLGIEKIDGCDLVGWSGADGYEWIDFTNVCSALEDGTPYYIITPMFEPADYTEDIC